MIGEGIMNNDLQNESQDPNSDNGTDNRDTATLKADSLDATAGGPDDTTHQTAAPSTMPTPDTQIASEQTQTTNEQPSGLSQATKAETESNAELPAKPTTDTPISDKKNQSNPSGDISEKKKHVDKTQTHIAPKVVKFDHQESSLSHLAQKYHLGTDGVLGIDITPEAIYICELHHDTSSDGAWKIRKLARSPLPENLTEYDIANKSSLFSDTLKKLISENDFKNSNAAIALPVSRAIVKTLTLPKMTDEQIDHAISIGAFWENFVQLSEDLCHYSIYHEIVRREDNESKMDVLFVAAKKQDIKTYTDIVTNAGLTPAVVDVSSFALYNAMHAYRGLDDPETSVAYLKLDSHDHYLHLLDNGESFLYELYLNAEDTRHLEKRLDDHDFIKRLSSQIKQFIATHENMHKMDKTAIIRVLSSTPHTKTIARKLGVLLTCYQLEPYEITQSVQFPDEYKEQLQIGQNAPEENHETAKWGVAIGLAMRQLDPFDSQKGILGANNVNLLPEAEIVKKDRRNNIITLLITGIAATIILSLMATSFFWINGQHKKLSNEVKSLATISIQHSTKKSEVSRLQGPANRLGSLEDMRRSLPANQEKILTSYETIHAALPYGVWLKEIRFDGATGITVSGNSLSDDSILQFIRILNQNDMLGTVSLKTMQADRERSIAGRPVKAFMLICDLII